MVKRKIKSKNKQIYAFIIIVIVLITIAGILIYFYHNRALSNSSNEAQTVSDEADDYVNLNPPTEQEKSEVNQNKESLPSNTNNNTKNENNNSSLKEVTPVITIARKVDGNVEVKSFVPDVYEIAGTCTATFTNGSKVVTSTSKGVKDATYTRCERILISASKFGGSGWQVVVSYKSSTAEGSSEKMEVDSL